MIKLTQLFILVLVVLLLPQGQAQILRPFALEWEPVEEASEYQIEISSPDGGQKKFKTKDPVFSSTLPPGIYKMRLRTFDDRGVPGTWSETTEFSVSLEAVQLIEPANASRVNIVGKHEGIVQFKWSAVTGGASYKLTVKNADGENNQVSSANSLDVNLKIGGGYSYSVVPLLPNNSEGERSSVWNFEVWGEPLDAPIIAQPDDEYVRKLSWSKPADAQWYTVVISFKDSVGSVWRTYAKYEKVTKNEIFFSEQNDGGEYALTVTAHAPFRNDSPQAQIQFNVAFGDRSPAGKKAEELRDSIERKQPYILLASWLYSQLSYAGTNTEYLSKTNFSASGGTGKVGVGYLHTDYNVGAQVFMDISGFTLAGTNYTFTAYELHMIYQYWNDISQIRWTFGYYQKELPELIGNANSTAYSVSKVKFTGPHVGVDYWRPFTKKLGYKANFRFYDTNGGNSTPNGRDIVSSFSYQAGLFGSLRLSEDIIGFAGYTYRLDRIAYKADPNSTGFATNGDINDVTITGSYLNLVLEWGF